jgi:hypothetical protein
MQACMVSRRQEREVMLSQRTNEESSCDDRVHGSGAIGLGLQLATVLAHKELRKAIQSLLAVTSNYATTADASIVVERLCRVAGRLADYHWALARELERATAARKVSRGRTLLRQHVAFGVGELVLQVERQTEEWRGCRDPQPLQRKTCSLALALGVASDHIAEDVARFAGRH